MNFLYWVIGIGFGGMIIYYIYAAIRDMRRKKNGKR